MNRLYLVPALGVVLLCGTASAQNGANCLDNVISSEALDDETVLLHTADGQVIASRLPNCPSLRGGEPISVTTQGGGKVCANYNEVRIDVNDYCRLGDFSLFAEESPRDIRNPLVK